MVRKVTGYQSASGDMFETPEEAAADERKHYANQLFGAFSDAVSIDALADRVVRNPGTVLSLLRAGGVQAYLRAPKESAE